MLSTIRRWLLAHRTLSSYLGISLMAAWIGAMAIWWPTDFWARPPLWIATVVVWFLLGYVLILLDLYWHYASDLQSEPDELIDEVVNEK